jgi:type II secretory pathway component PulF
VAAPAKPASLAITVLLMVVSLLFCLTCLWLMIFVIPRFEKTFSDFQMRVSYHTELTINVSRHIVKYWYVLLIALVPVYGLVGFISYFLRHRTNRRVLCRLWFVMIILVPLAIQGLMFLSVVETNLQLIDALGQ